MLANKIMGATSAAPDLNYIEDVFSTYLYAGNSSIQPITNGIDLAGKGGLVWLKDRTGATSHQLFDTQRGVEKVIYSNLTNAQATAAESVTSFNSNGFTVGQYGVNSVGQNPVSWTFRKQPKFFDVVTYTGTGSATTIPHNLGSVPGTIFVKSTSDATSWIVYHRSLGATKYIVLNATDAAATATVWNNTDPTSTVFSVSGTSAVNANGGTFVAYLFAHDAGGFGLSGEENVVTCGSYTGNGSTTGPIINLGYEPQWLMTKRADGTSRWLMLDNMRGWTASTTDNQQRLSADLATAEAADGSGIQLQSTGFQLRDADPALNANGGSFIYIAIRRGPMKVPTLGTTVFSTDIALDNATPSAIAGFVTDMMITSYRNGSNEYPSHFVANRLVGGNLALLTNSTAAESGYGAFGGWDNMVGSGTAVLQNYPVSNMAWMFRRAPSFFDEVCYTGTGTSGTAIPHNLSVVPELIISKSRSATGNWWVWGGSYLGGQTQGMNLDATYAAYAAWAAGSNPTSTNVYSGYNVIGASGVTYVAYLFATCAGVSKVGSYTGTGTTQAINCGFTTGARYVLIKRTDSTGDWYVWDSARGIVAGNDSYLLLNSTAAEVTGTDYIDPSSAGFEISSTAPAAINASGGSYIFLAVA